MKSHFRMVAIGGQVDGNELGAHILRAEHKAAIIAPAPYDPTIKPMRT